MDIKSILLKYIIGDLSDQEKATLKQWTDKDIRHANYLQKLQSRHNYSELYIQYKKKQSHKPRRILRFSRTLWQRAAFWVLPFLFALGIGYWTYIDQQKANITPGSSKANLYLANGTQLILDETMEPGWILVEKDQMVKNEKGVLQYVSPDTLKASKAKEYNQLKTPRGGEYRIVLPDGTKVRLNALSSLNYPTHFIGDNRIVELEGEAYFEIAKDSTRPFIVKANGLEIKQYGTKFSVNARSAQETTVVLEEGSIGVSSTDIEAKEHIMIPGEVVKWCEPTSEMTISQSEKESEQLTAWHNDRFSFDNETLGKVMENISLWYDADICFQDAEIASIHFTGNIGRYADIQVLLDAIENAANIHIKVEGKQIVLMNE